MKLAEQFIHLKKWAVAGASENQEKYGYKISERLISAGKTVYPINPNPGNIKGQQFYPDLLSLPELPDIVDIVVPPAIAYSVVEQCAEAGIKRVWFQPGTRSPEALERCGQLGIEAVNDSCVLVELDKIQK